MKLETYQLTVEEYLDRLNYAVIRSEGSTKLIQLRNLKLVQIESSADNSYVIQEVTQGKAGECWGDISIETVIEHIQMLEGGNDTFYKIWHTDDVLSLNPQLSRDFARLVLQMAMDNHDATIGINWEVLQFHIDRVLEMQSTRII
ncbi:hypothetical protein [Chamaesiphon sp.]|uniref:hypothetical protein n=1 Tax=Chamaesiphon sp. TaxID=2814140 RepID=UPI003594117E